MHRVFMEGTYDCGAACLAMALGLKTAADAHPILGFNPNTSPQRGVFDNEILGALHAMGRNYRIFIPQETISERQGIPMENLKGRINMLTRSEIQAMLGGMQSGCAIVVVPSLHSKDYEHFVYCERGEMHDPSAGAGLRYIGTAKSAPVIAAIVIEA